LKKNENPGPFSGSNPPFLPEVVGHNIRAIRLHLHLRQGEAAQRIGVSKRTLITYEKGDACPSLAVLETILKDCPEDPEAFFYGVLYPDIQSSTSFQKRGPNPFFFALIGVLFGGAVVSSIILPLKLTPNGETTSSSGSGPLTLTSSSQSESSTSDGSNTSSSGIAGLTDFWVITDSGLSFDAAMKPGDSLRISVFTGNYLTYSRLHKLTFTFSLLGEPVGATITPDSAQKDQAVVYLPSSISLPQYPFEVHASASDGTTSQNAIPLTIAINDTGTL
jgi:DNA-binding XRE family transcriptional regulator